MKLLNICTSGVNSEIFCQWHQYACAQQKELRSASPSVPLLIFTQANINSSPLFLCLIADVADWSVTADEPRIERRRACSLLGLLPPAGDGTTGTTSPAPAGNIGLSRCCHRCARSRAGKAHSRSLPSIDLPPSGSPPPHEGKDPLRGCTPGQGPCPSQ